tara:strand:- start:424 stop:1323 length:900 start_codon:yes stop_codon:yes gene_type:complete
MPKKSRIEFKGLSASNCFKIVREWYGQLENGMVPGRVANLDRLPDANGWNIFIELIPHPDMPPLSEEEKIIVLVRKRGKSLPTFPNTRPIKGNSKEIIWFMLTDVLVKQSRFYLEGSLERIPRCHVCGSFPVRPIETQISCFMNCLKTCSNREKHMSFAIQAKKVLEETRRPICKNGVFDLRYSIKMKSMKIRINRVNYYIDPNNEEEWHQAIGEPKMSRNEPEDIPLPIAECDTRGDQTLKASEPEHVVGGGFLSNKFKSVGVTDLSLSDATTKRPANLMVSGADIDTGVALYKSEIL